MKKALVFAAILFFLAAVIDARSIDGVGVGKTLEEAKVEACRDLASSLEIRIEVLTKSIQEEGGGKSAQSFGKYQKTEYAANLQAVEYDDPKSLLDGTWEVKAHITEKSMGLYKNRLENLANSLAGTDLEQKGANNELEAYYSQKLREYDEYNTCLIVVAILSDGKAEIPDVSIPSKSNLEGAWKKSLEGEISSITMRLKSLEMKCKREKLTDEQEAFIENSAAELRKLSQKRDEFKKSKEAERKELAKKLAGEEQDYLNKLEDILRFQGKEPSGLSAIDMVLVVEDHRDIYRTLKNNLSKQLEKLFSDFYQEADERSKAIYGRPYYEIELERGVPRVESLEARVNEADRELEKLYVTYFRAASDTFDDTCRQLEVVANEASGEVANLQNAKFTASTFNDEISTVIEKFDIRTGIWKGKAYFYLGEATIPIDFEIPYDKWTGNRTVASDRLDYPDYIADCDRWNTIFKTAPGAYDVDIAYNVTGDIRENHYKLVIEEVKVKHTVQNHRVVWTSPKKLVVEFSVGDNCEDMTLPFVENSFGICGPRETYVPVKAEPPCKVEFEAERESAPPKQEMASTPKFLFQRAERSALALRLGIDAQYSGGKAFSGFGFGLRGIVSKPILENTYFAGDLNLSVLVDDGFAKENLAGRVELGLKFMSYTGSFSYVEYGPALGFQLNLMDASEMGLIPVFGIGYGRDSEDSICFRIDASGGAQLVMDTKQVEPVFRIAFDLGFYLL